MTELDWFESRFLPAYRRYLDEAPAADAATMARAAVQARPRRVWSLWPTIHEAPRLLAWAVLMALLMLALIAAAAFLATRLPATAYVCPAGSNPDIAGPADQARPPVQYVQPMAFDQQAGRIVAVATENWEVYDTWTFDVCTNAWTKMSARLDVPWQGGSTMVYDPTADKTIVILGGRVWAYDLRADAWTPRTAAPPPLGVFGRLTYDSKMDRVIGQAGGDLTSTPAPLGLWSYDVAADAWTPIEQSGLPLAYVRPILAYDVTIDRLIVYDSQVQRHWTVDARSGQWIEGSNGAPTMGFDWAVSGNEIAYDESAGLIVAYSCGKLITYDSTSDSWSVLADTTDPVARAPVIGRPSLVYDTVNKRIVVLGSEYLPTDRAMTGTDVYGLNVVTGEWKVLLDLK